MLRRGALALALVLACSAPAWAAPAFVQGKGCGVTTGCSFSSGAPVAGHIISVIVDNTAAIGSVTVKDSASNALTEHQPSGNCVTANALCVAVFDEIAPSGLTAALTFSGITSFGAFASCMVEISGATTALANYAANNSLSVTTTLVATIAGVTSTDFQWGFNDATAYGGEVAYGLSNGTTNAITSESCGYALATSTASSTYTETVSGGNGTNSIVGYADYPAGGGGGGSSCGPYPYPCLFRPAYAPPIESWCWLCA